MADFTQAIGKTLLFEGGYVKDPSDSGGETYEGISRKNWPNWEGWTIIDTYPDKNLLSLKLAVQGFVVFFYRQNFWQFDGINDQMVAGKTFDLCVNVGKVHGIKILQLAAGVNTDGSYGPATETAVNAHPNGSLLPTIRIAAEQYHEQIVVTHPENAKFLKGWLRRDDS